MANKKNNCSSQETQRKLLQAAGEVFAEHGFHSATIKEITRRAGASIAAVNYHFNDKGELYEAVIRRIGEEGRSIIPPEDDPDADAREQFLTFVERLCSAMLGRPKEAWKSILLAREFAHPTEALDSLLEHVMRPINRRLSTIIARDTGLSPADPRIGLAVASVIAQCVYTLQHQDHIDRLHAQIRSNTSIERYARHIAQYSYAGMAPLRAAR